MTSDFLAFIEISGEDITTTILRMNNGESLVIILQGGNTFSHYQCQISMLSKVTYFLEKNSTWLKSHSIIISIGSTDFLVEGDILIPRTRNALKCANKQYSCRWPKSLTSGTVDVPYILSDKYGGFNCGACYSTNIHLVKHLRH